ncbi:hypothetical protein Vretimale_5050 [Volvox reticuliferus]|uniref:Uncharacterized protein n=1 Tax=Volvox reticuliferus TaxID=1737510 RepID=A0A8J4C3Q2_9CHLO|nr:hypothetical protein Vretifemale_4097 [Volvox reticuliferus]GIL99986.1 hypothetical protein Vretimale_5050 [Volvox reticuliferus]
MYISVIVLLAWAVLTCNGADGKQSAIRLQDSGSVLVPWLQPHNWKPLYAEDYNDLDAMLKQRATPDKWVSLFCFSTPGNRSGSPEEAAFLRLALNALYSYRVFGRASSDIVAALTPNALEECRKYRLPCYNATNYTLDSGSYHAIGWAKFKLTRDVLKLGFNVHLSDLDVSYLKPIYPARKEIFSWSHGAADGSMMEELWVFQDDPKNIATRRPIYMANAGVVFLRANSRSTQFVESLLKYESQVYQDQYVVTLVAYHSWAPCTEEASCLAARARGLAAVQLHPSQFAGSNCQPEAGYSHCAPRHLYVHAICRATSVDKEGFLRYVHAMFIRAGSGGSSDDASQPPGWGDPSVLGQQDNDAIRTSGLPCPPNQQRTWRDWLSVSDDNAGGDDKQEKTRPDGSGVQRQLLDTDGTSGGRTVGIDGGSRLRGWAMSCLAAEGCGNR